MTRKQKKQGKSPKRKHQRKERVGLLSRLRAPLASLLALVVLLGFCSGAFERVYHFFADDIRFVIRNEEFTKGEDHDVMKLKFSLINVCRQEVFVNSLKLRVGNYAVGGPPPTQMVIVTRIDRNFKVTLVRDALSGSLMPVIGEVTSEKSMGSKEFSILGKARIALKPREQVDYNLEIELKRPQDLAGKYDTIWAIGGVLVLEYERSDLKGGELRYPPNRL